jgi:hypothetical protein
MLAAYRGKTKNCFFGIFASVRLRSVGRNRGYGEAGRVFFSTFDGFSDENSGVKIAAIFDGFQVCKCGIQYFFPISSRWMGAYQQTQSFCNHCLFGIGRIYIYNN